MGGARTTIPALCAIIRRYAVVLTLEPTELSECAPLACRSCRKLVRKDCKADVDCPDAAADPLAALLPALEALLRRSPINFSNAALRFVRRLDDKPEEDPVLPAVWLRSWISAVSSDTMPWRP